MAHTKWYLIEMNKRRGRPKLKLVISPKDQATILLLREEGLLSAPEAYRIRAIELATEGIYSFEELANADGVESSKASVQNWVLRFRKNGLSGLLKRPQKSPRRDLSKDSAIWLLIAGIIGGRCPNGKQAQKFLNFHGCQASISTVNRWRRCWRADNTKGQSLQNKVRTFMGAAGLISPDDPRNHPNVKRAVATVKKLLNDIRNEPLGG